MIHLNFRSILDEIFAMTALRRTVAEGIEDAPGVLTRDNLPGLRVLVRSAFSRVATYLTPYLLDACTDLENTPAERPYSLDSPVTLDLDFGMYTQGLAAGTMMVLKRYLEHLLALWVLYSVYGGHYSCEASALMATIKEILDSPSPAPFTLNPCYY